MKVLTLKQPWATLIIEGYKKYEFRTWKTNYRGEVYIHAGKGIDKDALKRLESLNLKYPQSKILGKVVIEDCLELNDELNSKISKENPLVYGNKQHREGYAWKLGKVTKVNIEEEINGKLGLWEYNGKCKK